jgi:hypothetical protein
VSSHHHLKLTLKRGALVAAANWPVTLIQTTGDSLFKLLIAAPVIGGVFLVALVVGAEPRELLTAEWREMATMIIAALRSHPVVLAAFLLAVGVVAIGGSLFVFLIKGGTVAVLVRAERETGPIEQPPLHISKVATAAQFSTGFYVESARDLFPRYTRLGLMLMAVYLASASAYLVFVLTSRFAGQGWGITAIVTAAFVAWITIVNLLYLLVQIVIAADNCSVASAVPRVAAFLRYERRSVAAVFLIVLALVIVATGASFLATAALGLIAFVPFVGLAVLPLQLLAWVMRGVVFQYIGVTSIGAYLNLYLASADRAVRPASTGVVEPLIGNAG